MPTADPSSIFPIILLYCIIDYIIIYNHLLSLALLYELHFREVLYKNTIRKCVSLLLLVVSQRAAMGIKTRPKKKKKEKKNKIVGRRVPGDAEFRQ